MRTTTPTIAALALCAVFAACNLTSAPLDRDRIVTVDTTPEPCRLLLAVPAGDEAEISRLQQDLRASRSAVRAAEQLGYRFISRARLTNDPGFYTIAQHAADCMASLDATSEPALLLRGHALHQMHRFADAESVARQLIDRREFVLDFGLLGDALMEQGRLDEAAIAYQRMIDLKPFYQSYTRAAHLRWLRGDLPGATHLMHNAVRSASPRDPESIAWAYARLALYELQRGRIAGAARMADAALEYVPDYAPGLLARGRVLLADDRHTEATSALERAALANPLPEYQWTLADALRVSDRADEAQRIEAAITSAGPADDPRTVALFLATRASDRSAANRAIELARLELEKRADIFTLDALAWALFAAGDVRQSAAMMTRALAEGTQDGRLFLHAATIAAADGRTADAARYARKARSLRFTLLPSERDLLERSLDLHPARGN